MSIYKLTLQYNGQGYAGWQIQPDQKTLQGELNSVLQKISKSQAVKSLASGRTDAGVHAVGQVVRVEIPLDLQPEQLQAALNSLLSNNFWIKTVHKIDSSFHPIRDSKHKIYHYYFSEGKIINPFSQGLIANCSYLLDSSLMQQCANLFVGKHDFNLFHVKGSEPLSTIRTVFSCSVEFVDKSSEIPVVDAPVWVIKVCGEGFLKQMVRSIVGAIWAVGRGQATLQDVEKALSGSGKRVGAVAPADGLYLWHVEYE